MGEREGGMRSGVILPATLAGAGGRPSRGVWVQSGRVGGEWGWRGVGVRVRGGRGGLGRRWARGWRVWEGGEGG